MNDFESSSCKQTVYLGNYFVPNFGQYGKVSKILKYRLCITFNVRIYKLSCLFWMKDIFLRFGLVRSRYQCYDIDVHSLDKLFFPILRYLYALCIFTNWKTRLFVPLHFHRLYQSCTSNTALPSNWHLIYNIS